MSDIEQTHRAHKLYLNGSSDEALRTLPSLDTYASSAIVRAEILIATGEMEAAESAAHEAVRLCPSSPRALLLLEVLASSRQDQSTKPTLSQLFDEELPAMTTALDPIAVPSEPKPTDNESVPQESVDGTPALVSETLAKLMIKQGKFAEARKVYIQLARQQPERYQYFRDRMDELKDVQDRAHN